MTIGRMLFQQNKNILVICGLMILLASPLTFAHSGGTNQNGCHTNHDSGDYHCHTERSEGSYERQMDGYRQHNANKAFQVIKGFSFLCLLIGPIYYLIYRHIRKGEDERKRLVSRYSHKWQNQQEPVEKFWARPISNKELGSNIGFRNAQDLLCYACNGYHGDRSFSSCKHCREPKCRDCGKCNKTCEEKQKLLQEQIERQRKRRNKDEVEKLKLKRAFKEEPSTCFCKGTRRLYNKRHNRYVECTYCR